ncbi:MAG: hypothetical protein Q9162_003749 [Coniocarpon cinnabarinum]
MDFWEPMTGQVITGETEMNNVMLIISRTQPLERGEDETPAVYGVLEELVKGCRNYSVFWPQQAADRQPIGTRRKEAKLIANEHTLRVAVMLSDSIILSFVSLRASGFEQAGASMANSSLPGRANVNKEQIFIAANIVNAHLVRGAWGRSLAQLIEILGPENVFLSIYENDSGPETVEALTALNETLACNRSVVAGAHLDMETMASVPHPIPKLGRAVKRVEYLSHVRNKALAPLDVSNAVEDASADGFRAANDVVFDRLLFLNDVYFDALDAAHLLFSTRAESGTARYEAACALDFDSPLHFYDSLATRDFDGYGVGYGPHFRSFPWFGRGDSGQTRDAVLAGSDAVPVRSCWGGMVAFNARWFQPNVTSDPVRFRSTNELYWDASECCLINADISSKFLNENPAARDHGIFMNPYIRTAYDERTFQWIPLAKHFETAGAFLQDILTRFSVFPYDSERRQEEVGQEVRRRVWTSHRSDALLDQAHGQYREQSLIAEPGGFCGIRRMDVMRKDRLAALKKGEKTYDEFMSPGNLYKPF